MAVDPTPDARFAGQPWALAANADRERAIDVLKAGFAEGRLTKAEYDDRVARVYASSYLRRTRVARRGPARWATRRPGTVSGRHVPAAAPAQLGRRGLARLRYRRYSSPWA